MRTTQAGSAAGSRPYLSRSARSMVPANTACSEASGIRRRSRRRNGGTLKKGPAPHGPRRQARALGSPSAGVAQREKSLAQPRGSLAPRRCSGRGASTWSDPLPNAVRWALCTEVLAGACTSWSPPMSAWRHWCRHAPNGPDPARFAPSRHHRQRPDPLRQAEVLAVVNRDLDEGGAVDLERLHQCRVEIVGRPRPSVAAIAADRASPWTAMSLRLGLAMTVPASHPALGGRLATRW